MSVTLLDANQVIQSVYDEASQALRTSGGAGTQGVSGNVGITGEVNVATLDIIGTFEVDDSSIESSGGNYYQITNSITEVKRLVVYDTTGITLHIATGASGAEVLKLITGPGCDQTFDIAIPASTRIAVRSAGAAPSGGSLILNFQG